MVIIKGNHYMRLVMTSEKIKEMMTSCYLAKRILDLLPALPDGVLPSYIRYLEVVIELEDKGRSVKVSDVSSELELPRPGVTRTINSMVKKELLRKTTAKHDGRIIYISATDEGRRIYEKFNKEYFKELSEELGDVSEDDADRMINTIERFFAVMCRRRGKQ